MAKTLNEDFLGLAEMADKAAALAGSPFARHYWETVAQEYRALAAQTGQLSSGAPGPDLVLIRNQDFSRACRESGLNEDLPVDEGAEEADAHLRQVLTAAFGPGGKQRR